MLQNIKWHQAKNRESYHKVSLMNQMIQVENLHLTGQNTEKTPHYLNNKFNIFTCNLVFRNMLEQYFCFKIVKNLKRKKQSTTELYLSRNRNTIDPK